MTQATNAALAALMVAWAGLASAQAPLPSVDPARGATVEALVSEALARSPRVAAARAREEAAEGGRTQAGLRANPAVTVTRSDQVGGPDGRLAVEAMWPLELSRRSARQQVADRERAVAAIDVHEAEWRLAADVRREAGRLLAAVRLAGVMEEQVRAAESLRDLAQASVTAGNMAPLERDVAEVEVRRLRAELQVQRAAASAAGAALAALLGRDPSTPVVLAPTLDAEVAALRPADVSPAADAIAQRPDVRRLAAEAEVFRAESVAEAREGRADVDLVGGYMRTDMGFPQLGLMEDGMTVPIGARFHEVTVGASIKVPLFNRNQGARARAEANVRARELDRQAAVQTSEGEVRAAGARREAAVAAVGLYADGLVDLARHNLDVVRETYQLGRLSLRDVFAEQQRLLSLEVAHTAVLLEAYEADVTWREALGSIR